MIQLSRNILNLCFIFFFCNGVKSQWNTLPFQETCDFIYTAKTGITYFSSTSGWYIYDGLNVPTRLDMKELDNQNVQSNLFAGIGNTFWFSTYNRIVRLDLGTGSLQSLPIVLQVKDTLQSDYYVFDFDTLSRSLLIKQGLKLIQFDTGNYSSKVLAEGVSGRRVLTYRNASFTYFLSYYYTSSPQMVIIDSHLQGISAVYSWINWPDSCMANDVTFLDDGRVLIASSKGLMIGDISSRTVSFIADSLFSEGVRTLARCDEDSWLISAKGSGLTWLYRRNGTGEFYTADFNDEIPTRHIDRITVNSEGILFLVEYGKSIYFQNPLKVKFTNFDRTSYRSLLNSRLTEDMIRFGIQSTSSTRGGIPFIQTTRYKATSESPYHSSWITEIGGERKQLQHPNKAQLYRYFSNMSGALFANFLGEGLFEYKENAWVPIKSDFLPKGEINFYTGANGVEIASINQERLEIWRSAETDQPLYSFVFSGDMYNAYFDKNNQMFFISTDQGVLQTDQPFNQVRIIKDTKGIPCHCLLHDRVGNLWYSTLEGIVLLERKNETVKRFGFADGVSLAKYWPGKCIQLSPDSLVFFHEKGFTLVYPPGLMALSQESKVHFSEFRVNDLDWQKGEILNYTNKWEAEFSSNTISFTAHSVDLSDPLGTNIRFKLEGYDPEWIVAGKPNIQIRYPRLPPGQYILKVIGSNSDGIWNLSVKEITILIHPPFYLTWWFISLSSLTFISLLYWLVRSYYRRKLEKKNLLLREQALIIKNQQAIEHERTRIASEMHDDLGSGLTTIRYLSDKALMQAKDSEEVEQIQRIADHSNTLVRNMSEIIWAMNSRFDDAENLAGYLRRYASEYLEEHSIPFRFDIHDEELEKVNVRGEVRRNLFLVFKEVLHNTIKYSGATEVIIHLQIDNHVTIKVFELGAQGFDPITSEEKGNGLYNIKKRMDAIQGRISYEKSAEAMQIIFSAPIHVS